MSVHSKGDHGVSNEEGQELWTALDKIRLLDQHSPTRRRIRGAWVLDVAGRIRASRMIIEEPIPANPRPGQCRPCGMREHCDQAQR